MTPNASLAEHLLAHQDSGSLWPDDLKNALPSDVAQAYQLALQVRARRMSRGEQARGFKIGFTNRNIWPLYKVFGPIWGTVHDTTLTHSEGDAALSLAGRSQPRLEPEAVFGMKAAPPVGASIDALFECIDWVAPGFEIVQSHAPDWKFSAAMTVADGGLHSHLVVGPRVAITTVAPNAQSFNALFSSCQVTLHKNGAPVEQGIGANVLDGPLLALHHFLGELRQCPGAPDLQTGDVVTTGTWTDAWPIQAGDTWRAEFAAPLAALCVNFR